MKAITKVEFDKKSRGFTNLEDLERNLKDMKATLQPTIDTLLEYNAKSMLKTLEENFNRYANTVLHSKDEKHIDLASGYITKIRGGYNVALRGKNLWYYEFGTGDRGYDSAYPSPATLQKHNWVYNSGPKVIHGDEVNSHLDKAGLPNWYIGMVTKHPELDDANFWMSPFGPSRGIPAGAFWYDTVMEYRDRFRKFHKPYATHAEPGIQSLHVMIRNKVVNGKWK